MAANDAEGPLYRSAQPLYPSSPRTLVGLDLRGQFPEGFPEARVINHSQQPSAIRISDRWDSATESMDSPKEVGPCIQHGLAISGSETSKITGEDLVLRGGNPVEGVSSGGGNAAHSTIPGKVAKPGMPGVVGVGAVAEEVEVVTVVSFAISGMQERAASRIRRPRDHRGKGWGVRPMAEEGVLNRRSQPRRKARRESRGKGPPRCNVAHPVIPRKLRLRDSLLDQ